MVTRVDPNVASAEVLAALPGVSERVAAAIVAYREETHKGKPERRVFNSLSDLDAVKGVGPKTLERMAPFLRFGEER
jgi:competence ComEA-like helix-hairpin-helix protein